MQIFVEGCFVLFCFFFFLISEILRTWVVLSSFVIFCRLSCVKDPILIIPIYG